MILLVERLGKLYSKLENHHHLHTLADDSLKAFRSDVSNSFNKLISNSKPGSGILSFPWFEKVFEILSSINRAFAKLAVDIEYPMSSWGEASLEEYLNYSFNLLELLNSISSSLSHLGQARLSIAHALTLVENSPSAAAKHLKPIRLESLSTEFKGMEMKEDCEEKLHSAKERVIREALVEVKSAEFWMCAVVLASLSGDPKPYLEITKSHARFSNDPIIALDIYVREVIVEKGDMSREIREVNDAVACLESAIETGESKDAAVDLKRRSDALEKKLDNLGEVVNRLFSQVLAGRNELLDGVRLCK